MRSFNFRVRLLCACACPQCSQRTKFRKALISEYFVVCRAAGGRSGPPHDGGRKGLAAGEPVARHSAAECSGLRLVERGAARRGNNGGITTFPEPVGLAATFDTDVIHQMAIATSIEGRIKYVEGMKDGHSDIFQGLDFWAPNINIFRDPRWGRGQETYGEDPFLTARMGVAFVTGMQGDDPKYYRVISTPKHYAVHSGPESHAPQGRCDGQQA